MLHSTKIAHPLYSLDIYLINLFFTDLASLRLTFRYLSKKFKLFRDHNGYSFQDNYYLLTLKYTYIIKIKIDILYW